SRSRATRIANLSGTGTGTRLNGNNFLVTGSTVLDDVAADLLYSQAGAPTPDWLFYDPTRDKVKAQ
ncbi:hypothetical protein ACYOEI_10475, partial [Singulisphaera rosea]